MRTNDVRLALGNGWYRGRLGFHGSRNTLDVTVPDGATAVVDLDGRPATDLGPGSHRLTY